ncbi:MAG TPA: MFS transporter [Jiangellaceae bacterium]
MSMTAGAPERAGRKEWLGLALLALPSLLLFMMLTILFLAIPHLAADLAPSSTQLLWILDIYGFLIAGLLVTMGTLGDRIGRRRLLIAGAVVFGVVSVIAAYTDDPTIKDDPPAIALVTIGAGLVFGFWFVVRQLRSDEPVLDVRLFANRTVSGALAVFVLAATGLGGVYLLFTQYLQLVAGLSPLRAGLSILPAALVLIAVATFAPVLARRYHPGNIIAVGLAVQVVGYLMLTQVDSTSGLPLLIAGFIVLYPAVAPSMALTTDLVVGSVPPEKAGAASGLSTTASDLGISLGVAIVGSIAAATYRDQIDGSLPRGLPADVGTAAADTLDGAVAVAAQLPTDAGAAVLDAARAAFTSGLNLGAAAAAAIAAFAAILAATRLRHVPPTGPAPAEPATASEQALED